MFAGIIVGITWTIATVVLGIALDRILDLLIKTGLPRHCPPASAVV